MTITRAIQIMTEVATYTEAAALMDSLRTQEGFIGCRTLLPAPGKPSTRVQAFFEVPDGMFEHAPLPDDCRFVILPDAILRACTVRAKPVEPLPPALGLAIAYLEECFKDAEPMIGDGGRERCLKEAIRGVINEDATRRKQIIVGIAREEKGMESYNLGENLDGKPGPG